MQLIKHYANKMKRNINLVFLENRGSIYVLNKQVDRTLLYYNKRVTMRRVRENIVIVEKQQILHISVCVSVSACLCAYACSLTQAHAPYSHLRPLAPPHLSTLSQKRRDFRKEVTGH